MHRWMKVLRTLRSFRSGDVGLAAHNVLALTPGVDDVHVLASAGREAALSYECDPPVPFRRIDSGLDDEDIIRIETETGPSLPPLAYHRCESVYDAEKRGLGESPGTPCRPYHRILQEHHRR